MDDSTSDKILNTWLNANYERRIFRRWKINENGAVKFYGTEETCLIHDISPGGACIEFETSNKLSENDKIVLRLEGMAPLVAEVRSNFSGQLGLAFLHDEAGQQALAEWLTLEESTRRQHRRQDIDRPATLRKGDENYASVIKNISLGGAKIEAADDADFELGQDIALELDDIDPIKGTVRYKAGQTMGISFNHEPQSLKALIEWINSDRAQGSDKD